jgi:hypothetical protein
MAPKLNNKLTIHKLAADLGLRPSDSPVEGIVNYCRRKMKSFLRDFSECSTPAQLAEFAANKLGTLLVEIHSDGDLAAIRRDYLERGERGFVNLEDELAGEVYGVTLKRQHRNDWEQPYISLIDCRGRKAQRKYHTKWHELGHLLILTDQGRLAFRRTHDPAIPKSAEESIVDVIAGEFSFYEPLLRPFMEGEISFEKIEAIRCEHCPEASIYSAILNLSKIWPLPCIWLEAALAHKKGDQSHNQESFSFKPVPAMKLRAIHVSPNARAREVGLTMIPNWRVPKSSIIYRVFEAAQSDEAVEDLAAWESSDGSRLNARRVRVKAKKVGDSVHALVVPVS